MTYNVFSGTLNPAQSINLSAAKIELNLYPQNEILNTPLPIICSARRLCRLANCPRSNDRNRCGLSRHLQRDCGLPWRREVGEMKQQQRGANVRRECMYV